MRATFITGILEGALAEGWQGGTTAFRKDLPPGSVEFTRRADGAVNCIRITCPCGCGSVGTLPLWKDGAKDRWTWDGDLMNPTLTPSIQMLTPCRWHGYLIKGDFQKC